MDIKIIAKTDVDPLDLASHAAGVCYQSVIPEFGKRLDVEKRLFKPSHHTTLQHHSVTFAVEGIAVGDITFGMHLAHPFYNSDQRSGRYAAKMFLEPEDAYAKIEKYIKQFWPEVDGEILEKVMNYVKRGVGIYHGNIKKAEEVAEKFVSEERPFASEIIKKNIPKYAQEQMRMFIPVIFPTAFNLTLNKTALIAMYESAWTPPMRYVTEEMVRLFTDKYPETVFMFNLERRRKTDWAASLNDISIRGVKHEPELELLNIYNADKFVEPSDDITHPVDRLHFTPEMMNNSIGEIATKIKISLAAMGQDQRHRTIRRSAPQFTGDFYLPPILRELGLEQEAISYLNEWKKIGRFAPETLVMILAPYGAMATYEKAGSFNAIAHEQGKRLCWCAQEEIYHLGKLQRLAIEEKFGKKHPLLNIFEPPCYRNGKCTEGDRYCGRDRSQKLRNSDNYFPKRKI
ncbi:TPA: hypothetical protein DEW47_02115 [Patescibacteria group bacterium]|nr:MAG: hypothetical protein UT71_C0002G0027 [Parcubacteria group bacterium GW2011_GWF2_40_10]KKR47804.1 MAG: hypothetical protein UT83_C0003G0017 [Parcubacteria group bacterium GW2011_GWA2_40_143]KKR60235.1 MAG: hypothetical protein UT97_C0003G0017 [Parcubacteria group bacterium GW2011_GWC2_40_31]KKR75205.1 MAG: hypothetical protein UU18_C0011G0010 [Parcubacteria group bacterium GW2011_GWB2_40_8]KKR77318.1 MAG: hypothetical protein UU20_C0010G0008 [Parcubacteria group bacterium GW2011_GWE2_40_